MPFFCHFDIHLNELISSIQPVSSTGNEIAIKNAGDGAVSQGFSQVMSASSASNSRLSWSVSAVCGRWYSQQPAPFTRRPPGPNSNGLRYLFDWNACLRAAIGVAMATGRIMTWRHAASRVQRLGPAGLAGRPRGGGPQRNGWRGAGRGLIRESSLSRGAAPASLNDARAACGCISMISRAWPPRTGVVNWMDGWWAVQVSGLHSGLDEPATFIGEWWRGWPGHVYVVWRPPPRATPDSHVWSLNGTSIRFADQYGGFARNENLDEICNVGEKSHFCPSLHFRNKSCP